MAQQPTLRNDASYDPSMGLGLSSPSNPSGGHAAFQSESEIPNAHLAFKEIAPISAGSRGYRSDVQGYVELLPDGIREGIYGSTYSGAVTSRLGTATVCYANNNEIELEGFSAPWTHYNKTRLKLDPLSPVKDAKNGQQFDVTMEITAQCSNYARQGEQEHLDDFERAFDLTHQNVINAVTAARANPGRVKIDPGPPASVQAQVYLAKRQLIQTVTTFLLRVDAKLVPAIAWDTQPKIKAVTAQLEGHWKKLFERLCELSKIRDYTGSHSAGSVLRVNRAYQAPQFLDVSAQHQPASKNDPFAGGSGGVNPLYAQKKSAPDPFAGKSNVNPLFASSAQGGARSPAPQIRQVAAVPGEMRIILNGGTPLRGGADRLISFQNRYLDLSQSVSKDSPNVRAFTW